MKNQLAPRKQLDTKLLNTILKEEAIDMATSQDMHPSDVAEILEGVSHGKISALFQQLDIHLQKDIFVQLSESKRVELAEYLPFSLMSSLLTYMPADDRVDLLKALPEPQANALMRTLAQAKRDDILKLLAYEEGTIGAVMTSDYITLGPNLSADMAIATLRQVAPNKETIYYCYIIDDNRNLIGFVSLKDLILADPKTHVKDIMRKDVIYVSANDDQETAATMISEYDLLAIPVVNDDKELVGIVTHDDALDILNQEQTEDIEKFMAIGGSHKETYLHSTAWTHFKNRAWWLVSLAIIGLISGWILHNYESTLDRLFLLALYLPMIADTGGNSGSQSATVMVRALALNEINIKDFVWVIIKELQVSIMMACVLSLLAFAKVLFLSHGEAIPLGFSLYTIAMAIALALAIQVITSTIIGAILPLAAHYFNRDPAVIASPALTTLVDITGLLIFFSITKLLLNI